MKPEFVEQVKEMDGAEKVLPLYVFKNNIQGNSEPISRLEGTDNLEWYNRPRTNCKSRNPVCRRTYGNLDSHTGAEIMSLLQRINKERGQTIIMVTHSPEAAKSSNRVITVSDGLLQ